MASIDKNSSNAEKVVFFRSLFSGRGDVFAKRYDNAKTGKKGYSPYCENQWVRGLCGLMHGVKCSDCPNRKLKPVSDEVIRWHLRGKDGGLKPFEMGAYPKTVLSFSTNEEFGLFCISDHERRDILRESIY